MIKHTLKFLLIIFFFSSTIMSQNISVMTYNIRLDVAVDGENAWPHRKDFLVSQLQFHAPNIIGTQEGQQHQIEFIDQKLEKYNFIGKGRDGADKGEYSAIFYNREKLKVENDSTFWLSETPDKMSKGWDAAFPRICTYGLFTDLRSLEKFWVFNTHLDHIGVQARSNSIKLIIERINIVNTKNYPVILMGDFNAEPDSDLIKNLKNQMEDAKDISKLQFGPEGTFNAFQFTKPVTRRIDYIMLSKAKQIKVKKYAVLSDSKDVKYPSDHLPVFIKLKLN